jgi:hypothetical protein
VKEAWHVLNTVIVRTGDLAIFTGHQDIVLRAGGGRYSVTGLNCQRSRTFSYFMKFYYKYVRYVRHVTEVHFRAVITTHTYSTHFSSEKLYFAHRKYL